MNWKLGLGLACVALSASQAAVPSKVELVSAPFVAPGQTVAGNGASTGSVVSGDGRIVAFTSNANNLTTNDLADGILGGYLDVFARDLAGGPTRLISVNPAGTNSGNGDSFLAGVSRDGRRIVFESDASDLVPDDRNGARDVLVRDLDRGVTLLVSANAAGNGSGSGESSNASISRDGRFVVFESDATNLVTGDTNNVRDVFVRDLAAGSTTLVSRGANGLAFANGASDSALISDDGSVVMFSSAASNLAAGDTNKLIDIFVRDLRTGTNVNLTVALRAFTTAGSESYQFALSGDGRRVVFQAGDGATLGRNVDDGVIYRRDLDRTTNAVVARLNTNLSHGAAESLDVSADGRYIIYGLNGVISRVDNETGITDKVAVDYTGTNPVMTPDGRWVAFLGMRVATGGPVPGDPEAQVYVRDMSTNVIKRASTREDGNASTGNDIAIPTLSDDGRWVAFESFDALMVPGDVNRAYDVFLRDTEGGETTLASVARPGTVSVTGNGSSRFEPGSASADGRYLVYSSLVETLVANDTNGLADVFLFDRERRTNLLVSVSLAGSGSANGSSTAAILSANGQVAGFFSTASNLTLGKTNNATDFYVRDLARGVTTRVDPVRFPGSPSSAAISLPALSADGRYLAFAKGDTVYRLDLSNNTATNVVRGGNSLQLAINADGSLVAVSGSVSAQVLWEAATGISTRIAALNPGFEAFSFDANGGTLFFSHSQGGSYQIRALNLPATNAVLVTANLAGQPQASATRPDLSASVDGNRVAFVSADEQLAAGDTNRLRDVFVRDRRAGTNILVSVNAAGTASGNGLSDSPRLSADGRYVLFRSEATDLVLGEPISDAAIFQRDLQTGVTTLVSRNHTGTGGPGLRVAPPLLSADGSTAYFMSLADDLVAGDENTQQDVFFVRLATDTPVVTDRDNDGMPDDWEIRYFEDLTHTGTGDADHDGLRDRDEFLAGTSPVNPESSLRVELIHVAEMEWTLRWSTVAGKTYRIQRRFSLNGGAWTDVPGETVGNGGIVSVPLPAVIDAEGGFFQVVIR